MRANLIVSINEITIRDYTIIEDEGLGELAAATHLGWSGITLTYERDEESPKKNMILITGPDLPTLFKFLDFIELPVKIIS